MPIRNYSFKPLGGMLRPILPIVIINPHSNKSHKTLGIIDTGADTCTISREIADILGHNMEKGDKGEATSVGAKVQTWLHTTTINMLDFNSKIFHTIKNAKIEYVDNFDYVVLGVEDFLEKYRLEIDYPKRRFSIRRSRTNKLKTLTP